MSQEPAISRSAVGRLASGLVVPVLLLAIGLAGGWFAASQGRSKPAEEEHAAAPGKISPRTLANIGVELGDPVLTDFVRSREVPAEVELPPAAVRPAHAPVAGVVRSVVVALGQKVAAGAPIAEIVRDPFPRPTLTLTDAILQPLDENFHESLTELRASTQAHAIAEQELERVRALLRAEGGGASPLPAKAEIDLVYEERRTREALERARREVERHGLAAEEIDSALRGHAVAMTGTAIREVLRRSQLWTKSADAVLAALPEDLASLRFTVAVLGELSAANAIRDDYVAALKERPALGAAFLETAGLIQQGATVEGLKMLEARGALAPVVVVRAPDGAPDWDVTRLEVTPGAHVEAGDVLATCADRRDVLLRLAPAGADLPALARALETGESVRAEPLVPGSGPSLDSLPLVRLAPAEGRASHGAAFAAARNAPLAERADGAAAHRTWKLREGLRYLVQVPVERLTGRFVLPAAAVVPRGSDMIVLLEDGDSFRALPVRVEHLDARVAVVANDGALFAKDRIVLKGAYALSLALQAGSGGRGDPHAGHSHN